MVQRRRVQTYGAEDEPYTQPRIHAVVFDPGASRRPVAFARIGPNLKSKATTASSDGDKSHRWRNRARKPRQHAKPPRAGTGELKELQVNWKQELDKLGPIYNLYAPETAEARAERLGDGEAGSGGAPEEEGPGRARVVVGHAGTGHALG